MKNTDKLLHELIKSDSIMSSKSLAVKLNVSSRSITNYINEINRYETVIFSSKKGYWIDKEKAKKYFEQQFDVPQDFNERSEYIIHRLLSYHNEKINIYKLCDELFVSYSTIKNDLSKMNLQYHYLGVEFILRNNYLQIRGNEKNKRKLMSKTIYDQHKNILNIQFLEESFPKVKITLLVEIITKTFKKYNYYLNDFSRMNLIIHYSIMIDRMMNGHLIHSIEEIDLSNTSSVEKLMIEDLTEQLANVFNLTLSKDEIYELLIILRVNAQKTDVEQSILFKEHTNDKIVYYVNDLILKLKERYYLDLYDDQFIVPFTLHLNNLYERLKHHLTNYQNPMAEQLKKSSPILYDIALYIAKDFCDHFHFENHLSMDEIGFIAIHIGSKIERDNISEEKLNVLLICPNYIHLAASIRNKLLYNLGTKINILNTVSEFSESDLNDCDIIISTVKLTINITQPFMVISPFVSDLDISNIYKCLTTAKNIKNFAILKKNYSTFFDERNFIVTNQVLTKYEAIHLMVQKMCDNGYVKKDYEEKVLERENSSPTSFYNFAIPHSFEMDANMSGVCVLISKNEIPWDFEMVTIVLLIAMNKKDNMHFYPLYEAIITFLTDEKRNHIIKNVNTYDEFKSIILNY